MIDVYFETAYGKLYERTERGTCEVFGHTCPAGTVRSMFIRREIPVKLGRMTYYDIITPYGYGGPVVETCNEGRRHELVRSFFRAFSQYCEENSIVSEFIRFHPVVGNSEDFASYYDVAHMRNTVGTDLVSYDDPVQSEFSKSCRRNIRKALREGMDYRITRSPGCIDEFMDIYFATMDRNRAQSCYYFDRRYFEQCVRSLKEYIVTVEAMYRDKCVAMALCFAYGTNIHIHLSGTLTEYLHLSPAYVLRYAITTWGKQNGYSLIHHGGGRTNNPDDSLYLFKRQFGRNTEFRFCIGRKVWNREVYDRMCSVLGVDKDSMFFPAYRSQMR